jgi:hypothetical protein
MHEVDVARGLLTAFCQQHGHRVQSQSGSGFAPAVAPRPGTRASRDTAGNDGREEPMNSRSLLALLMIGLAILPVRATAGSGAMVSGSGNVVDDTRALSGFSVLVLRAPVDVTLKAGDTERVTLRGDDNILPLIETKIVGGRLEISTRRKASFSMQRSIKATVEFKRIDAIRIAGSGDVRADTIKTPVLEIEIRGAGDVKIDQVEADALAVSVAGSGDVAAKGRAAKIGVVVDGSGDVDVAGVEAKQAAVRIHGSGDVKVHATDVLEAESVGSGDVRYRGSPQVRKTVRGSGAVAPLK